jgi:hypothetical protein
MRPLGCFAVRPDSSRIGRLVGALRSATRGFPRMPVTEGECVSPLITTDQAQRSI